MSWLHQMTLNQAGLQTPPTVPTQKPGSSGSEQVHIMWICSSFYCSKTQEGDLNVANFELNSQKTQTAAVIIIIRDISVNEPHSHWQASFPDCSESLLTSIRGKIRMQRYVTNTAFFWLLVVIYKLYSKRSSEFL